MGLTEAQQAAVDARNRQLLVSAAAGSGKTRVLIERIFSLISRDHLSVDRMLIVTFTHAAAAEMRERLQARLSEAADTDRDIRRQAELMETAQISTLHSFCQKLVREYFQAVDIDPQAMLGDEAICANLKSKAQSDAMDALYERAASGDAYAQSLTRKFDEKQIDRMISDLYPFLMAMPDPFVWLEDQAAHTYGPEDLIKGNMAETLLADCGMLVSGASELAQRNLRLAENPLCPEAYLPVIKSDQIAVKAVEDAISDGLPAVSTAVKTFLLMRLPSLRKLEPEQENIRDEYKGNRDQIKKLIGAVSENVPDDPQTAINRLNAMQPSLAALAALIRDTDERYGAAKKERNLIDFSDLERMALRILANPDIREEIASRYDGVFVDEYQDISAVQEAILNALKRDVSRETSGVPQRYFYVGDVKQSIYRFRQADPTLFMGKAKSFSPDRDAPARRITLNANFRSRETVLSAVNRVFERVMRSDVTEIDYDTEARLYPGVPSVGDPPVSLHLFTQPVRAGERAALQAYAIAREIAFRVGKPLADREGKPSGVLRYRDIAILAPKMKGVSDVLERTLNEMGIPVYCEDRGSGMATEETAQALNFLRLLNNASDDLALLGWLRGPAVGMNERELAEIRLKSFSGSYLNAVLAMASETSALAGRCKALMEALERERFLAAEMPLDEYLWGWLNRSGLYAFYGCQPGGRLRQANLRMLCEKAGEYEKHRGGGLQNFLASVEAQAGVQDSASPTVLSPHEDVVRVMTIHKSKGLEFPVVFVMGLEESFSRRDRSELAAHARLGVALPYVNEEMRTTSDTMLKAAINLRRQAEEKAERARLLYVAMTRAQEELILLGCAQDAIPQQIGAGTDEKDSAYTIFGAGSMLDWVRLCLDGRDVVEEATPEGVIDNPVWRNDQSGQLSTESTSIPQKQGAWRVVFHNAPQELETALLRSRGLAEREELDQRGKRLAELAEQVRLHGADAEPMGTQPDDPVAPKLRFVHHPFKVGVTALTRAEKEAAGQAELTGSVSENEDGELETVEIKRLPLALARPKLMDDLPELPAFLRPPAEQTGLMRGVAAHKALSLLTYAGLRDAGEDRNALEAEVRRQLDALAVRRLFTPEERERVDVASVAGFFADPCGRRALSASQVRREWSFNLLLPERGGLIAQGVVDLCYVVDGTWELVDYKTDRVEDPAKLWALYGEQIELYRRALREATGLTVRGATLFSLALGRGDTRQ